MRRAKLLVLLLGLFTVSAIGCGDTQKPADKTKPAPAPNQKPAEGSGATPVKKPAEGSGSN